MTSEAQWLDRLAIQDVLTRYAHALDSRQPALLEQVFLADADIDYRAAGGVRGGLQEWQDWLHPSMARFDSWQHLLANFVIEVDGDRATALTRCYNPLQGHREDGSRYVVHAGARYEDELVRTEAGWRIARRTLGMDWMDDGQFPVAL